MIRQLLIVLITICVMYSASNAQSAGDLDTSFDGDGKVTTDIKAGGDIGYALVIQSDGKIIEAGSVGVPGNGWDFGLARYNTNGSLDAAFGNGGKVTTHFGSDFDGAFAVTLQSDGKIVAAGATQYQGDPNDQAFALARYETNGNPDLTFGPTNDGKVITNLSPSFDQILAVAMQGDHIVVAGFVTSGGFMDFALARYTPDGDLDTSFGSAGIVLQSFCVVDDRAEAMIVQPDGTILLAGIGGQSCTDFAVAKFSPDGVLDTNFGIQGLATADFGGYDIAKDIDLQLDGKIVAAGYTDQGGNLVDFAVARFDVTGSLDSSFDLDGKAITDFGSSDFAYGVAVQTDGKIVTAGYSGLLNASDFSLARCNPDGSPDLNFGTNGLVVTPFSTGIDQAHDIALQPDGKIIAAGWTESGAFGDFALARYHALPPPPCLFCDDFEDGILAPDWTYVKPSWNESAGAIVGTPSAKKAEAIASPVFNGCTVCSVEATMMTAGGSFNRLWLLAWYLDKKNTIEVLMKEENDSWIVKQRSGGLVVAKAKASAEILPNTFYNVTISFDGVNFVLTVNNIQVLTMPCCCCTNWYSWISCQEHNCKFWFDLCRLTTSLWNFHFHCVYIVC